MSIIWSMSPQISTSILTYWFVSHHRHLSSWLKSMMSCCRDIDICVCARHIWINGCRKYPTTLAVRVAEFYRSTRNRLHYKPPATNTSSISSPKTLWLIFRKKWSATRVYMDKRQQSTGRGTSYPTPSDALRRTRHISPSHLRPKCPGFLARHMPNPYPTPSAKPRWIPYR